MSKQPMTLQQRFGFQDNDLRHPGHDQIMQWLSKVAPKMLATWIGPAGSWPSERIRELHGQLQQTVAKHTAELQKSLEAARSREDRPNTALGRQLAELSAANTSRFERLAAALKTLDGLDITPPAAFPDIRIDGPPEWEFPVTSANYGNKPFVVGFADMAVRFHRPHLSLDLGDLSSQMFGDWQQSGRPLEKPSYFVWMRECAYFEVKTEIPSLGELMRQINLYRTYLKGRWYIVSPDTRHVETLAEQNVGFIEYNPSIA